MEQGKRGAGFQPWVGAVFGLAGAEDGVGFFCQVLLLRLFGLDVLLQRMAFLGKPPFHARHLLGGHLQLGLPAAEVRPLPPSRHHPAARAGFRRRTVCCRIRFGGFLAMLCGFVLLPQLFDVVVGAASSGGQVLVGV